MPKPNDQDDAMRLSCRSRGTRLLLTALCALVFLTGFPPSFPNAPSDDPALAAFAGLSFGIICVGILLLVWAGDPQERSGAAATLLSAVSIMLIFVGCFGVVYLLIVCSKYGAWADLAPLGPSFLYFSFFLLCVSATTLLRRAWR
jgi:hypothetical protein